MIATITLNPSIDQHIKVQHLVKDDVNRANSVSNSAGGKGLNVSKVVRELGGPTRAYALVGGYVGGWWERLLMTLDIRYTAYPVAGETRVNVVFSEEKDRTQTRVSAPGPRVSNKELEGFLEKLCHLRSKPSFWVLGGSLPAGADPGLYEHFIRCIQKTSAPCVLDADGESLRRGVKAKPFMIKPNEFEMQRLTGRPLKSVDEYHRAAREVVRSGVKIVIVSLAARGALFVTENEAFHASGIDVPVRSHIGAGDSLIGGFLLGLYRKKSLEDAAKLRIAASTSAVMREAPRLCVAGDMAGLLKRVKITELATRDKRHATRKTATRKR